MIWQWIESRVVPVSSRTGTPAVLAKGIPGWQRTTVVVDAVGDVSNHGWVLRIHFSAADIARTRVMPRPDPLWEIVLSLHVLQSRERSKWHQEWYSGATQRIMQAGILSQIKHLLLPLAPVASYFPDFLTPAESVEGVDVGIDTVVGTPGPVMSKQFTFMASRTSVPGWAQALADGDRELRGSLGTALRSYHDTVLEPWLEDISACVTTDSAVRNRMFSDGGVNGVLDSLRPIARWEEPILAAEYPRDLDVPLGGRGLVLIPSYFCSRTPVALVDPGMQPVLVYPALECTTETLARCGDPDEAALANLLGATRAAVLLAIGAGCATKRLASHAGVTPATISHHTTVLREAGLIATRRFANMAVHTLTPRGANLIGRPSDTRRSTTHLGSRSHA